jgi:O-antigen/teichoic acid export membrane protein
MPWSFFQRGVARIGFGGATRDDDASAARRAAAAKWAESVASLGVTAVLQLASFVLLARAIGPADYAVVIGVASVTSIAAEFVGLGAGTTLMRSVARDPATYPVAFGHALILFAATLPVTVFISIVLVRLIYPLDTPLAVVVALTASDLTSVRALVLSEQIALAGRNIRLANAYRVAPVALRLAVVVVACYAFGVRSVNQWAYWQVLFVAMIVPGVFGAVIVRFGRPRFTVRRFALFDSVMFAQTELLRAVQFSVDRFVVGRLVDAEMLGMYGAVMRFVQYSMIPIVAILRITYPRFFFHGQNGIAHSRAYALKILPFVICAAAGVSVALVLFSGLIGAALGPRFSPVAGMLRAAALIPVGVAMQYTLGDALTGADEQKLRTSVLAGGVCVLGLLAAIGANLGGVYGAIFGVLGGHIVLAIAFVVAVEVKSRAERDACSDRPRSGGRP